jgi:hypothetical protein
MKNSDVKVGAVYRCKISERIVPVTVLAQTEKIGFGKTRVAFRVRNEVTGRVLVKTAAALRPAPERPETTAAADMAAIIDWIG